MPTYVYKCVQCAIQHEVVKSIKLASQEEICPTCSITMNRVYTTFQILGSKVEDAEFNLGLGCVTKSARHRAEIAKQRGLIEIGNESPETLHKEVVVKKEKAREEEWNKL